MKCRSIYKRIASLQVRLVLSTDDEDTEKKTWNEQTEDEQKQQQQFNSIILLGISSRSIGGILVWRDKNTAQRREEKEMFAHFIW